MLEAASARRRLLAEANRARDRGNLRRAAEQFRRLLLAEPEDTELALQAAPVLAAGGEAFEAWQLFRSAAARLRRERRLEACHAALRDACRCVPFEFDAWVLRADLEIELGREEVAFETLLEGRRVFEGPRTAAQAIALLERARRLDRRDPGVALDLAELQARRGLRDEAAGLLASLGPALAPAERRRARLLAWRIGGSPRALLGWLEDLFAGGAGEAVPGTPPPARDPDALERLRAAPEDGECLLLEHEVSA